MRITLLLVLTLAQDGLVAGELKKVVGGMRNIGVPAPDGKGNVYFADVANDCIMKWDGKQATVWRKDGRGANGMRFDKKGNLLVAEMTGRHLRLYLPEQIVNTSDNRIGGWPGTEGGKWGFSCPYDLCTKGEESVYFTDTSNPKVDPKKEGIFYLPNTKVFPRLVADDLKRPRSIHLHENRLYIAASGKVYSYITQEDGSLKDKKVFLTLDCNGLRGDEKGNLYVATEKGIEIYSPEGKKLQVIRTPDVPSGCAFDGKKLYVSAKTTLYVVDMNVTGD